MSAYGGLYPSTIPPAAGSGEERDLVANICFTLQEKLWRR